MDMNGSAKFKSVPIIDVTKENVAVVKPLIRGGIIGADFIAIDCVSTYLSNHFCSRALLLRSSRSMNIVIVVQHSDSHKYIYFPIKCNTIWFQLVMVVCLVDIDKH
jgi:hypothetical protein